MDVKYTTDTKIEDNARQYKLQKAQFDREINTAVSFFCVESEKCLYAQGRTSVRSKQLFLLSVGLAVRPNLKPT